MESEEKKAIRGSFRGMGLRIVQDIEDACDLYDELARETEYYKAVGIYDQIVMRLGSFQTDGMVREMLRMAERELEGKWDED